MTIQWQAFLIPGVFYTLLGLVAIAIFGLGPLQIGSAVSGLFLILAAVLQRRADLD